MSKFRQRLKKFFKRIRDVAFLKSTYPFSLYKKFTEAMETYFRYSCLLVVKLEVPLVLSGRTKGYRSFKKVAIL